MYFTEREDLGNPGQMCIHWDQNIHVDTVVDIFTFLLENTCDTCFSLTFCRHTLLRQVVLSQVKFMVWFHFIRTISSGTIVSIRAIS